MSEMVERVARSIDEQMSLDDNMPCDIARAAIAAMREPTQEMIDAYRATPHNSSPQDRYRAMIDAVITKR